MCGFYGFATLASLPCLSRAVPGLQPGAVRPPTHGRVRTLFVTETDCTAEHARRASARAVLPRRPAPALAAAGGAGGTAIARLTSGSMVHQRLVW